MIMLNIFQIAPKLARICSMYISRRQDVLNSSNINIFPMLIESRLSGISFSFQVSRSSVLIDEMKRKPS